MHTITCLALLAGAAIAVRLEGLDLNNATKDTVHCEMDCVQRKGWRRGHWILELPKDKQTLPYFNPRRFYFVQADGECIAKNRVEVDPKNWTIADVVPFVDEEHPTTKSELHVYVNPMLLVTLRQHQAHLLAKLKVCDYPSGAEEPKGEARGQCLCNLIPPEGRSSLVARVPFFPGGVISRLDQLESDCGAEIPLLVEYFVMTLMIGIAAVAVHTSYCLWSLPKDPRPAQRAVEDEEDPSEEDPSKDDRDEAAEAAEGRDAQRSTRQAAAAEGEEEEGETAEDVAERASVFKELDAEGPAVVIKSPWNCFRECCSKLIGVVLIIVSLQTLLVQYIIWIVNRHVMYTIIAVIFLFSVVSVTRMMVTVAQDQLVHAAFAAGFALTKKPPLPSSVPWLNLATVIFVLMLLGLALGADVSSFVTSGKALFTALMALAGPIWRVCKEHLSTALLASAIEKSHVTFSIQGLAAMMDQRSPPLAATRSRASTSGTTAVRRSRLETALCSGELPFVPFGVLIGAARNNKPIRQAFRTSTMSFQVTPASHADVSYQCFDMRWLGRSVYELTGSRWGFSMIPVLCGVLCILSVASLLQLVSYTCLVPELEMLSLQAAGTDIDFQPWRYKYVVELDQSFRAVGLAMSYNSRYIRHVEFNHTDTKMEGWRPQDMKSIRLDGSFPHMAEVHVTSVRGDTWSYSLRFLPTRTLANSVYLTAGGSKRCMSLTRMEGAVLSVPPQATDVAVCVKLIEYTLTVPVLDCWDAAHPDMARLESVSYPRSTVLTTFCPETQIKSRRGRWHGLQAKACKEQCRTRGDCLDAFPGKAGGCYFAITLDKECDGANRCVRKQGKEGVGEAAELAYAPLLLDYGQENSTNLGRLCESSDLDGLDCPSASVDKKKSEVSFPPFNLTSCIGNERIDLTFTLALSPNQQQLDSIVEQLRLSRRPPEPTMLLSQIQAPAPPLQAKPTVTIDHKASLSDRVITVTLKRYLPSEIAENKKMFLDLVPLLPDPDAIVTWVDWAPVHSHKTDHKPEFAACKDNRLIANRYSFCEVEKGSAGNARWGNWSEVLHLGLSPYSPSVAGLYAQVQTPYFHEQRQHHNETAQMRLLRAPHSLQREEKEEEDAVWFAVELKLDGAMSPAKWVLEHELMESKAMNKTCELRWPGMHIQTLFGDTETLCMLAEHGCDVVFEDGIAPDTLERTTKSRELLSAALLEGIAASLPHRYVPILSCTWASNRPGAAKVSHFEFLTQDTASVRMDVESMTAENVPVDSILTDIAESNNHVMLNAMCKAARQPQILGSEQLVKVLGKVLHTFVNVEVSDKIVEDVVKCVADQRLDEDALRYLSTYLLQSWRFDDYFTEVQNLPNASWTQALVATAVEGRREGFMDGLRKELLTRLHFRIKRHGEMQVLKFFNTFILYEPVGLQELDLLLDWRFTVEDVRQATIDQFGEMLRNTLPLRKLALRSPAVPHIEKWLSLQKQITGLETLVIEATRDPLPVPVVKTLSERILEQSETLESLGLNGIFTASSFADFVSMITAGEDGASPLPKLKVLSLSANSIGKDDIAPLTTLIRRLPSLTHIDLESNMLNDTGLRSFADAIEPKAAQLQEVNLWSQRTASDGSSLEYLVLDKLKEAPNLRSFHFSSMDAVDGFTGRELYGPVRQTKTTLGILKKGIENWPSIEDVRASCERFKNLVNHTMEDCNVLWLY